MVKRSVRRTAVTAADLKSAQARSEAKKRKRKSLTRAAQQHFVARAKRRGLMKRAAERVDEALPHAPTKLQQLEAQVRAGVARNPLAECAGAQDMMPTPNDSRASFVDSRPDPLPFREREENVSGGKEEDAAGDISLTDRVRALYETGVVPVREIARLCGVTERTLYKYAARGRWRKRYVRRALTKGEGGRFVVEGDDDTEQAAGLKALDPVTAAATEAACAQAETVARCAAASALAEHEAQTARETVLREFETRARRLAALAKILKYAGPEFGGLTPWPG